MSMQNAVQQRLVIPPAAAWVSSRAERTTLNLAVVKSHAQTATPSVPQSPTWLQPAAAPPVSRLGKGGAFAIAVLIHALGFYALSKMPTEMRQALAEPLQILMLSEPEAQKELPPPPPPVTRMDFTPPAEPVINVVVEQPTNSIAVAPRIEPVSNTPPSYGAPKTVSTVEYVREPAAKYPPAARALKQRGIVTLRALIDVDGHAREVDVQRSSGSHLLDDAGRVAVLNALFKPYMENGHAIPVYVFVPIEFTTASRS